MRRTPHGVRGLKLKVLNLFPRCPGRTPHGVRGLKYRFAPFTPCPIVRRTPHGVRGLKSTLSR